MLCSVCKLTNVCECRCCRRGKQGWGRQGQPAGSCQQCWTGVEKQISAAWSFCCDCSIVIRYQIQTNANLAKMMRSVSLWHFEFWEVLSCKTLQILRVFGPTCVWIGLSVQSIWVQLPSGMMLKSQCWWKERSSSTVQEVYYCASQLKGTSVTDFLHFYYPQQLDRLVTFWL